VNKPAGFKMGTARSGNVICRRLESRSHLAGEGRDRIRVSSTLCRQTGKNSVDDDYLFRRRGGRRCHGVVTPMR
jgi:hypothetical protein